MAYKYLKDGQGFWYSIKNRYKIGGDNYGAMARANYMEDMEMYDGGDDKYKEIIGDIDDDNGGASKDFVGSYNIDSNDEDFCGTVTNKDIT